MAEDEWYKLNHPEKRRWWFPIPCKPKCLKDMNIGRFHFTCLTCPIRRLRYQSYGHQNFTTYKKVIMVLESASGKGFVFPKRFKAYGLIIGLNSKGKVGTRGYLLKWLLTIAERIAEF